MNLFRYFESPEIRDARQHTEDLQRLVLLAKIEQQAAEEKLRKKLKEAATHNKEAHDLRTRFPIAGALVWKGRLDD